MCALCWVLLLLPNRQLIGHNSCEIRVLCTPAESQALKNTFGGSETESTFENAIAHI